jgi:hypothetical protein
MSEHTYFQFPLYALAYGKEPKQRLDELISFCCVEVGYKESAGMTLAEKKTKAAELNNKPNGFHQSDSVHLSLVIGMIKLAVMHGNAQTMVNEHERVSSFICSMNARHGNSPFVRIRNDLLWEALKGDMDYRRFSVLCAVYSVIGSKDYCRVTRGRIIAGALGYKSAAMMTPEVLAQRTDGAKPLTENQVRRTLDGLEYSSLFARVQVSKRKVVFSNRMFRGDLVKTLRESAIKKARKLANHRKEDRELMSAIKAVNDPTPSPHSYQLATYRPPWAPPLK